MWSPPAPSRSIDPDAPCQPALDAGGDPAGLLRPRYAFADVFGPPLPARRFDWAGTSRRSTGTCAAVQTPDRRRRRSWTCPGMRETGAGAGPVAAGAGRAAAQPPRASPGPASRSGAAGGGSGRRGVSRRPTASSRATTCRRSWMAAWSGLTVVGNRAVAGVRLFRRAGPAGAGRPALRRDVARPAGPGGEPSTWTARSTT